MAPRAADVELRLETLPSTRLPVLGSTRDARWCRPGHGRIYCEVRVGVPAQGVWTVVAKRSSPPPAAVEITLGSTPG
jgi:hypothetical protein